MMYALQTLFASYNRNFPTYLAKNFMKIKCFFFNVFYVKIHFDIKFTHKITISQFSRAWSHNDVIRGLNMNGWYVFRDQRKENGLRYTLVVKRLSDLQY